MKRSFLIDLLKDIVGHYSLKKVVPVLVLVIIAASTRLSLFSRLQEYTFEPDTYEVVYETRMFCDFFSNLSERPVPSVSKHTNYLDGPYIIYALNTNILKLTSGEILSEHGISANDDSFILFAIRYTNYLLWIFSIIIIYFILMHITGRHSLSFFISLGCVLLSPQNLSISMLRIDHFYFFCAVGCFYFSLLCLTSPGKKAYWFALGFLLSLSVVTKFNIPFYLTFPVLILLPLLSGKRVMRNYFLITLPVFLVCTVLFLFRWVLHYQTFIAFLEVVGKSALDWHQDTPVYSGLFHLSRFILPAANPDMLYSYGFATGSEHLNSAVFNQTLPWSLFSMIFLLVMAAAIVIIIKAIIKNKNKVLTLCLALFILYLSALLVGKPLARYGIFIPVFFSVILGFSIRHIIHTRIRKAALFILYAALSLIFLFNLYSYIRTYNFNRESDRANLETRIRAREWLNNNVKQGSRVLLYSSEPTWNPPVYDLKYDFSFRIFDSAMAYNESSGRFVCVPDRAQMEKDADIIILNSNHVFSHLSQCPRPPMYHPFSALYHTLSLSDKTLPDTAQRNPGLPCGSGFVPLEVLTVMWQDGLSLEQAMNKFACLKSSDSLVTLLGEITGKNIKEMKFDGLCRYAGENILYPGWAACFLSVNRSYHGQIFTSEHSGANISRWIEIKIVNPACLINYSAVYSDRKIKHAKHQCRIYDF